jgi:hypothetical protein
MHSGTFGESKIEGDPNQYLDIDGRIILKLMLGKLYGTEWTVLIKLKLGPSGKLL